MRNTSLPISAHGRVARPTKLLLGNKVGDKRIRAGVPAGWTVGDKTGTGDYGTTNDAGVIWPASRAPIVLVVYYTQTQAEARAKDDVIASVARIVAQTFG
jgi:beta-lactamase class A